MGLMRKDTDTRVNDPPRTIQYLKLERGAKFATSQAHGSGKEKKIKMVKCENMEEMTNE